MNRTLPALPDLRRRLRALLAGAVALLGSAGAGAADPPLFGGFIPQGTPVIDGEIGASEWDPLGRITLYKFFGEDARVDVHLMWDQRYLYVAADVDDYELWVDDFVPTASWRSTWMDDAFKLEIDPDFSRDPLLQADDRVLAINADGSAVRFDRGDGAGGTSGAAPPDPIIHQARYSGTLNDWDFKGFAQGQAPVSARDGGFVIEAAISWRNLRGSAGAPADGHSLGLNPVSIEDDTGGDLDPEYYESWKRVFDEITRYLGEEGRPEGWAEMVISSNLDITPPANPTGLAATRVTPFSARLGFQAPGDNGAAGYAHRYEVRTATAGPVTAATWDSATPYANAVQPRRAGSAERLQIIGLQPGTTYHAGVRALDERGNPSGIAGVSFTTPAAAAASRGNVTVCPGQHYLCYENGEALVTLGLNEGLTLKSLRGLYDGDQWNAQAGRMWNYSENPGPEESLDWLRTLSEHGVNTIRLMLESYDPSRPPVYLFEDLSGGPGNIVYEQATLDFLERVLDEAAKLGINLVLTPFDTIFYREQWDQIPFSTAMGGPMHSPEDFFEPQYRGYLESILRTLVETVGERENVLAWELVNEIDSGLIAYGGWNRAPYARRAETARSLAAFVKSIDPGRLVFISSVRWDPKDTTHIPPGDLSSIPGADNVLVLNTDALDLNSTHFYHHDIRDISHNHPGNTTVDGLFTYQVADLDNTLAPAAHIRQALQFMRAYSLRPKPFLSSEYGPLSLFTDRYDAYFTEADDNLFFRNALWAHLASGDTGGGLRWPGDVRTRDGDDSLTPAMLDSLRSLAAFAASGLDFTTFAPRNIGQDMTVAGTATPLITTGISDEDQGIAFLLKDDRLQTYPAVHGARLRVPGLRPFSRMTVETWDPSTNPTAPASTLALETDEDGDLQVPVPPLDDALALKFYRSGDAQPAEGARVTDDLWLRAVIHTETAGPIEGVWQEGGDAFTARGDRVIWGYFHASPEDVSWGSPNNPDVFVKIWFDVSGAIYIGYFHVSVPDITLSSDYRHDGFPDESDTATLATRYIQHTYHAAGAPCSDADETAEASCTVAQVEDGLPAEGDAPGANPAASRTLDSLDIGAVINSDQGPLEARWYPGGAGTTARGDRVVWGFFYADPNDVSWGSPANPDLFVKLWFDASGLTIVDAFHVSVPDIEFVSRDGGGAWAQKGTTRLDNRFIEHRY